MGTRFHFGKILPGSVQRIQVAGTRAQVDIINGKIITAQFVNLVCSSFLGLAADVI